jgi:hypothetical protein
MDNNVNAMNTEIAIIEQSIRRDMHSMNSGIYSMSQSLLIMDASVEQIANDVGRMSNMVEGMSYDIHRGTDSFTSPVDYMQNMLP